MNNPQKKIFAIGDIHGCADELKRLIEQLPLEKDSTLVFLGDYINRGDQSRQVIDYILALNSQYHVVALMGNHEAMFLDFLRDRSSQGAGAFIYNGGGTTLASYGVDDPDAPCQLPPAHEAFFKSLPIYYATDDYFFVHAGLPDIPIEDIETQKHKKTMLWIRDKFHRSKFNWGRLVIHGHTPITEVDFRKNRVNIDTACAYNNKLTAIELPSMALHSVIRLEPLVPKRFTTPHSRRDSARFRGSLRVFVKHADALIEFRTGDYSETGMNIHARRNPHSLVLQMDETVEGYVSSHDHDMVAFRGDVVRIWQQGEGICYGLKLEPGATRVVASQGGADGPGEADS